MKIEAVQTQTLPTQTAVPIEIRPVVNITGCEHFQHLERLVWGTHEIDVVPVHVLITALKNGGGLLGAYAESGPEATGGMVGAAFWWLGAGIDARRPEAEPGASPAHLSQRLPQRLKVCSHMVGVLPEWQGRHVGLRLKLAQREQVLAQGLTDWITWTYDPLYRRNGVFNIHRLGATCSTYLRNVYGELNDELNQGGPSDRCEVDWRLNSPHVLRELQPLRPLPEYRHADLHFLPVAWDARGFAQPVDAPPVLDGKALAVPVPDEIGEIRRIDPALGLAWRFAMRAMLETAFAAGYMLVDCIHAGAEGWRYVLVREYL